MEKVAEEIVGYIDEKQNHKLNKEEKEILVFGVQGFLEISCNLIASLIIAIIFHCFVDVIFFFCVFIPIRSYAGGYHADKYCHCFIISIMLLVGMLILTKYWNLSIGILMISIISIEIIIWKNGLVVNENRPLSIREYNDFSNKLKKRLLIELVIAILLGVMKLNKYLMIMMLSMSLVLIGMMIGRIKDKNMY